VQLDERSFIRSTTTARPPPKHLAVGDCVRGPMLAHKAKGEGVMVGDISPAVTAT
jgi:dihydrolipoamide dehydrogenase